MSLKGHLPLIHLVPPSSRDDPLCQVFVPFKITSHATSGTVHFERKKMRQTPKQIKAEEKRMMLAFFLIIAVLLSFQFFTPKEENIIKMIF